MRHALLIYCSHYINSQVIEVLHEKKINSWLPHLFVYPSIYPSIIYSPIQKLICEHLPLLDIILMEL